MRVPGETYKIVQETLAEDMLLVFADPTSDLVATYEQLFTNLAVPKRAIVFTYARTALRSILLAMGMGRGDEIVLSPLTCKVVPLALLSLGLKPVYVDISANTLNLDPQRVASAIGPATRAVLFQHTYGSSAGVEAIAKVAAHQKLPMVEDCAQCLPYATDDRFPGSWGQAAIFSNNLLKPLPAGSGGVAVTNDGELAQKIQEIRDGLPERGKYSDIMLRLEIWIHKYMLRPALYWAFFSLYRKFSPSYRARPVDVEIMDEVTSKAYHVSPYQMREGARWLRKLASNAAHRRLCCAEYTQALRNFKGLNLPAAGMSQPLYYFPVLVGNKEELLKKARRRRIELIAWPTRTLIYPIENKQDLPAYGYEPGTCPVAEEVATQLIGLPTHCKITTQDRNRIVDLLTSQTR
jgi:dTDP-4-amino-4,6-dideoxygalactose transaminase